MLERAYNTMTGWSDFDLNSDDIVKREVIPHDRAVTDRSIARRVALQALYEIDSTSHSFGDVLVNHMSIDQDVRKVRRHIYRLVHGVVTHMELLDRVLQTYAPEWPIEQVAFVDRNILRIALFEMGVEVRTPVSVAIDEAVELAKLFGADGSSRFINGVLGAVATNLEEVRETLKDIEAENYEVPELPKDGDGNTGTAE